MLIVATAAQRLNGAAWRRASLHLSSVAACALLASCGGGSGGDAGSASAVQIPTASGAAASSEPVTISVTSQGETATPTPDPTPTPTPTPAPAPTLKASPAVYSLDKAPAGSLTSYNTQTGACINMGNHLEAPNEGDWGRKLTEQDFKDIAAVGFQTIRLPVRWSSHADTAPPYTVDPAFFARIDQILKWSIDGAKLRVVLDFHHYDELMADPEGHKERFAAIWRQVAKRYSTRGFKLWFELLNEPKDKITNDNVASIIDPALAAIRETNPTRPVVYTGAVGSTVWSLYSIKLPKDPNLIVTVHDYTPSDYTHQGMAGYATANLSGITFGSTADVFTMNDHVNVVKSYMAATGRPVWLGEYGVNESVPVEERAKYYNMVSQAYLKARVYSCAWSYTAGGFAFRDKTTNEWSKPLLKAIGL